MEFFYKVKLQLVRDNSIARESVQLKFTQDAVNYINSIEHYENEANEVVALIMLDTKNYIIAYSEISRGNVNSCQIDIPSIFKTLFQTNANKFILVHNHPSGDSTPSKIDIDVTKRIQEASSLLGVQFLDHIVIGENNYTSIMQKLNNKEVI